MSAMLLSSCKSYQKTTYNKTRNIHTNKLLRQVKKHHFSAKSLDSRITISYKDKQQDFSGNGHLKILKDSIIWGSLNFLGIPMVKFYITPKTIRYYNKIDQTYYNGNFDLLHQAFGIPINFDNLQNLLLGDPIINLASYNPKLQIDKKYYGVHIEDPYVDQIKITPFYKVLWTHFIKPLNSEINLSYKEYKHISQQDIPETIYLELKNKKIQINYKSINLNKELRFPFKHPQGYKKLNITNL